MVPEDVTPNLLRNIKLTPDIKFIICYVYKCLLVEENSGSLRYSLHRSRKRLQYYFPWSRPTLKKCIRLDGMRPEENIVAPAKKKRGCKSKLDYSDKVATKEFVEQQIAASEVVTIKKVQHMLKTKRNKDVSHTLVAVFMNSLEFSFGKPVNNSLDKVRSEEESQNWLIRYLENIRADRKERRKIIYIDETQFSWRLPDGILSSRKSSGEQNQWIALEAGNENGFLEGGILFKRTNDGDYHKEMNSKHFEEWFEDTLLPQLDGPTTIVLDNVAYHSRVSNRPPAKSSKKSDLLEWLKKHSNQPLPTRASSKAELLEMVHKTNADKHMVVDRMAEVHGHRVERLPPHRSELNPFESMWALINGHIGKYNCDQTIEYVRDVYNEAKILYKDKWKECCRHVRQKEEEILMSTAEENIERLDQSVHSNTAV